MDLAHTGQIAQVFSVIFLFYTVNSFFFSKGHKTWIKKCYNTILMCTHTPVCGVKKPTEYSCTVQKYRHIVRGTPSSTSHCFLEFEPLSVNLCWPMKTVQEEEVKGSASLCLSSTERPPCVLGGNCRQSEKFVSDLPQLFSKSDRRSSLLLLGRSGGSRYDNSSSGLASSGRRSKEGSGMSDTPWLSKLLEGLKDRSLWGWLLGPGGC